MRYYIARQSSHLLTMKTFKSWQLQDAKNRFSEVVERAINEGPQLVTRRGKSAVIVMAAEEFKKFGAKETSLVEFFRQSPLCGVDLDLTRVNELGREVDFDVSD